MAIYRVLNYSMPGGSDSCSPRYRTQRIARVGSTQPNKNPPQPFGHEGFLVSRIKLEWNELLQVLTTWDKLIKDMNSKRIVASVN